MVPHEKMKLLGFDCCADQSFEYALQPSKHVGQLVQHLVQKHMTLEAYEVAGVGGGSSSLDDEVSSV